MKAFNDLAIFLGISPPPARSPIAEALHRLEEAQKDSLEIEAKAEEYTAMAEMLQGRVARLKDTVSQLMNVEYGEGPKLMTLTEVTNLFNRMEAQDAETEKG